MHSNSGESQDHSWWLNLWAHYVMKPKNWWIPLSIVIFIGIGSMVFIGTKTYTDAPPRVNFVTTNGDVVFTKDQIIQGQVYFLKYAFMDYGSMFGDGALRGPDFTADALHQTSVFMEEFYANQNGGNQDAYDLARIRTQREIKQNGFSEKEQLIYLSEGEVFAGHKLRQHFAKVIRQDMQGIVPQVKNISDAELDAITAFFFWGGWVCGAERDSTGYSYTNNWPYDPDAGNLPTSEIVLWSVLATLGLILALGIVLFLHGRFASLVGWGSKAKTPAPTTLAEMEKVTPTALQLATFKYFLAATLLFGLQILAGVLTVHNFLGLHSILGFNISDYLPLTAVRGWHLQLAVLWVTACWVGGSIFLISTLTKEAPKGQLFLVNLLFWVFVLMVVGNLTGVLLGPQGYFGDYWNELGNQGWEFVEMGKVWQYVLMGILILWLIILYRGVQPVWKKYSAWFLPKWLVYCVACVILLFISGFIAKPETNFVIADYWRWAVIHMWVEAFFEVFATILVAYCMYLMGFIDQQAAQRVIYIATLLFLGSGLLGISHNFYWNAKPVATLAIGSIFSTLQIVPLILLTLEAWQFRKLPREVLTRQGVPLAQHQSQFSHSAAFGFLLAVNFWNFFGAGVFGFIVNLPIVNYYEHGSYLTVNHGHAAFMGVYGNLALGAMFFCVRYLVRDGVWSTRLIVSAVWSLNVGLFLMCLMDLFPAGIHQLNEIMNHGFWFARNEAFIQSSTFQTMTWARMLGGLIFVFGGLLPITIFMLTRAKKLKSFDDAK